MTVIETALASGDIDAARDEAERLKVERAQRMARQRVEGQETDIIMEFIGLTNPAAIDAMIAGQS